jgi:hypothetical protein
MHLLQPKHPQTRKMSIEVHILNIIIYNCKKKKKLQKFGDGNLYEKSEDESVDVYAQ